jgi:hypothetical protein
MVRQRRHRCDVSDMWIHEGWGTYLECLFVEYMYGHADYLAYVNAEKNKVRNIEPIIPPHGIHKDPPQDQYFKGACSCTRCAASFDDDAGWFALIRDMYQRFKYKTILTEDVVQFFNQQTGHEPDANLQRVPAARRRSDAAIDVRRNGANTSAIAGRRARRNLRCRSRRQPERWQLVRPTLEWQMMPWSGKPTDFEVATDLYYVYVERQ